MIDVNPFPAIIFKETFQFNDTHLAAAKDIIHMSDASKNSHLEKGNARSSIANQDLAPHGHPAFEDFFTWMHPVADDIIKNKFHLSGYYNYYVGNSWINVHGLDGKTVEHNHGMSVLSIVAYIKVPENSGFTEFKDPYYNFKSLHEQDDSLLKEWFSVPIKAGDVLFFPGWLPHRSQPNKNINERWILSANFINFVMSVPYDIHNFIKS